jgi:hypothetical protein
MADKHATAGWVRATDWILMNCSRLAFADALPSPPSGGAICGRIWTPPDCNGLAGSGSRVTIADVYPALLSGPIHRRRKPRWVSACFVPNGPEASACAVPVHTSG